MLLSILRTSVGSVLGGGSGISKSSQLSSVSGGVGGRFACLSSISSECLSCGIGSSIGARTEIMVYTSVKPNGFVTSLIHIFSYKNVKPRNTSNGFSNDKRISKSNIQQYTIFRITIRALHPPKHIRHTPVLCTPPTSTPEEKPIAPPSRTRDRLACIVPPSAEEADVMASPKAVSKSVVDLCPALQR